MKTQSEFLKNIDCRRITNVEAAYSAWAYQEDHIYVHNLPNFAIVE